MERLTYRDDNYRAHLTLYGKQMYGSTQATADCICELEEALLEMQKSKKPDCEAANHDAGGCLGYGHSESDDEPIEACKICDMYTGNHERQ